MTWKLRPVEFNHYRLKLIFRRRLVGYPAGCFFPSCFKIRKLKSSVYLLRKQQMLHSHQVSFAHFVRNYWSLD